MASASHADSAEMSSVEPQDEVHPWSFGEDCNGSICPAREKVAVFLGDLSSPPLSLLW
jgi:hypothetical protein